MHVVATAGHVDHGKSSLVRALAGGPGGVDGFTGGSPSDRLAEEQRRGLTIDLGYLWTRLTVGTGEDDVAFVDVPGHERFVPTMLAGVGPVPAVLFVVAADGGWMPQSSEHRDALAALGVRHGVVALTRADLADRLGPDQRAAVLDRVRAELAGTSLADLPAVAVSSTTGQGLPALRAALGAALAGVPAPDPAAPARLWVDRSFAVRGAGTVVTGTLPAGTVRAGDQLALVDGSRVVVRGVQVLERPVTSATGTARVALNLRGVPASAVHRGDALSTPGTTTAAEAVDVRLRPVRTSEPGRAPHDGPRWPEQLVLHLGSAAVPVRVRPMDAAHARLALRTPLPLRVGDVGLLRDPGGHRVLAGVVVLDPAPPPLGRRGAARERAGVLAGAAEHPDAAGELRRRGVVVLDRLRELGVSEDGAASLASAPGVLRDGGHLLDPGAAAALRPRLAGEVEAHRREHPLEAGPTLEAVRRRLGLPTTGLVEALLPGTTTADGERLAARDGRVVAVVPVVPAVPAAAGGSAGSGPALPPAVAGAVAEVLADLADAPFAAPEAHRLRDLGLGPRELAAAVRVGALARVAEGVYLAPAALDGAAAALVGLPQPFAMADARRAWGTSRRVAVPLLELLDRRGATRRLPDSTRTLTR